MTTAVSHTVLNARAHNSAANRVFFNPLAAKNLPTVVLGVSIMAVVTAVERALDAFDTGFALEWSLLTLVALATFGLCADGIRRATKSAQLWWADYGVHAQQTRDDVNHLLAARQNTRLAAEMSAAQPRAALVTKHYRLRAGWLS